MAKKAAQKAKPKKIIPLIVGIIVIVVAGAAAWLVHNRNQTPAEPLSRRLLTVQIAYIKQNKPPPTQAALEYAYLTTVYNKALQASGQNAGLSAGQQMLDIMYAKKQSATNQSISQLRTDYKLGKLTTDQQKAANDVVAVYKNRWLTDGHTKVWTGTIPTGPGKWVKVTDKGPFTPLAGSWKRWGVDKAISVPPPPVYGSEQDKKELAIVKRAVAKRTGEDVNTINFWGGTPGTETPAGIWQNQLYRTVTSDLPNNHLAADKAYATVQQNLAQTISDAFMECWKVKYTYWTARPNMIASSIKTAMPNPPFPGYVSGHSTISKAAADVLSVMVPSHAQEWESMAVEARQSRLVAGIHFNVDNMVGFQVGADVAKQMNANLAITKQL